MEEILLNASLQEKKSEKSGKKYYVIEIQLTPNYSKQVFLEQSEIELVKLYISMINDDTGSL